MKKNREQNYNRKRKWILRLKKLILPNSSAPSGLSSCSSFETWAGIQSPISSQSTAQLDSKALTSIPRKLNTRCERFVKHPLPVCRALSKSITQSVTDTTENQWSYQLLHGGWLNWKSPSQELTWPLPVFLCANSQLLLYYWKCNITKMSRITCVTDKLGILPNSLNFFI